MKRIAYLLMISLAGLTAFGQEGSRYLPQVAWMTNVDSVIMTGVDTFMVKVDPIDYNQPGAINRTIGNYLKDYIGHTYKVIDSSSTTITVVDVFGTGVGPQQNQYGVVYQSPGGGEAPYLAPIYYTHLDKSALDYSRRIELAVLWEKVATLDTLLSDSTQFLIQMLMDTTVQLRIELHDSTSYLEALLNDSTRWLVDMINDTTLQLRTEMGDTVTYLEGMIGDSIQQVRAELADSSAYLRGLIAELSTNLQNEADSSFTNADEADPVFSNWNRRDGISITESQITDLDHFTNDDETDPVFQSYPAYNILQLDIDNWDDTLDSIPALRTDINTNLGKDTTGIFHTNRGLLNAIDDTAQVCADTTQWDATIYYVNTRVNDTVAYILEIINDTVQNILAVVDTVNAQNITNAEEADPVFSNWNKQDGVSVTLSQITDLTNLRDVNGNIIVLNSVEVNDTVYTDHFQMGTGATDGYYFKCDANGNASWGSISGALIYKGTWDAETNTPTLADGSGTNGWYYRVVVPDTINLGSGDIVFEIGDDVMYNGSTWECIPGSGYVQTIASATNLGEVQIGDNINVTAGGIISVDAESDPVFSDWNKTDGISITESQVSDLQDYLLESDLSNLRDSVLANTGKDTTGVFHTNRALIDAIDVTDTTWWGQQPAVPTLLTELDSTGFDLDTSQVRNLQTYVENYSVGTETDPVYAADSNNIVWFTELDTAYSGLMDEIDTKAEWFESGNLMENISGLNFSDTRLVIGGYTYLQLDAGYEIPLSSDIQEGKNALDSIGIHRNELNENTHDIDSLFTILGDSTAYLEQMIADSTGQIRAELNTAKQNLENALSDSTQHVLGLIPFAYTESFEASANDDDEFNLTKTALTTYGATVAFNGSVIPENKYTLAAGSLTIGGYGVYKYDKVTITYYYLQP